MMALVSSSWPRSVAPLAVATPSVAAAPISATSTAAASGTAPTTAGRSGTRLVHVESSSLMVAAVQARNRRIRLGVVGHLDESEATTSTGLPVAQDLGRVDRPERLEELLKILRGGRKTEITDIKPFRHRYRLEQAPPIRQRGRNSEIGRLGKCHVRPETSTAIDLVAVLRPRPHPAGYGEFLAFRREDSFPVETVACPHLLTLVSIGLGKLSFQRRCSRP
jgi:hypothetical protein